MGGERQIRKKKNESHCDLCYKKTGPIGTRSTSPGPTSARQLVEMSGWPSPAWSAQNHGLGPMGLGTRRRPGPNLRSIMIQSDVSSKF